MKTFTRKLVFLMIFLSSIVMSTYAQTHFTVDSGDYTQPRWELWICEATFPGGLSLEAGDEIAIYDGSKIVGALVLTVSPSSTNWTSSCLHAFTVFANGNSGYTAGNTPTFRAWDASATTEYFTTTFTVDPDLPATWTGSTFPVDFSYCCIHLDFSAVSNATASGDVFKTDGVTAIDGATVTVGGAYTGTSIGDGSYSISGIQPGTWDVTASKPGYVTETQAGEVFTAGNNTVVPDFTLDDAGDIDGHVYRSDGTTAIEGATVSTSAGGNTYTTTTIADGSYTLSDLPTGATNVTASKTGYDDETISVTVVAGSTTTQNFTLDLESATITGNVTDLVLTSAIVGATVTDGTNSTLTDALGDYTLTGVTPGFVTLTVSKTGYYSKTYSSIYTTSGGTTTQDASLFPVASLHFSFGGGNPAGDTWTLYIHSASFAGTDMVAYDEIAIFDGATMVGHIVLTQVCNNSNKLENDLVAFATLAGGAGYTPGAAYSFKAWDWSASAEYTVFTKTLTGSYTGALFPAAADEYSFLEIDLTIPPGSITGTCKDNVPADVDGVTVTATNTVTSATYTAISAAGYTIINVPVGTYNLTAQKLGYQDYSAGAPLTVNTGAATTHNITILPITVFPTQNISLSAGYQFVSRNIVDQSGPPVLTTMAEYTTALIAIPDLISVKNTAGNLYSKPGAVWVDNIGTWVKEEGYLFFMQNSATLSITGYLIDPSLVPITLATGHQFISYLPNSAMNAQTVFANILDHMDWAKNSAGAKLREIGGTWINNIGTISPGEGIQLKMTGADVLTYPANPGPAPMSGAQTYEMQHFNFEGGNAADPTYTIYIYTDYFGIGDEIAAFDGDKLVGAMVLESIDPWQNDLNAFSSLNDGPGYSPGNPIILKGWDATEDKEYSLNFEFSDPYGIAYMGTVYPTGDMHYSLASVTKNTSGIIELNSNSVKVYPNPATGFVNIYAPVKIQEVEIYDLLGNKVHSSVFDNEFIRISTGNLSHGVYIIRLKYGQNIINKKLTIQ